MHASFITILVVVASIVAPALSTSLGYAVIPLNFVVSADFFVAFAAYLTLLSATPLRLPHVSPRRNQGVLTLQLGTSDLIGSTLKHEDMLSWGCTDQSTTSILAIKQSNDARVLQLSDERP